jgi:CheY-like chemotaxis protein
VPEATRKKVILVVEDHPLNMRLAVDLLTLGGFNVLEAADGETALEVVKTNRPDLVLLDIRLPGMDGFELFRKIREDASLNPIKIVALTASVMRAEEQKIVDLGFTDYITKPIDTKQFIKKIQAIVE